MDKFTWKSFSTLIKILIPIILMVSVGININQCSNNYKLSKQLAHKDSLISKPDSLLEVILNNDSIQISKFEVNNSVEISKELIAKKIDSLKSKGTLGNSNPNLNKGGYYTKTKFKTSLKNVKPTLENDSIAEYTDKNWYIGYNKKSSIFNAEYNGEQEVLLSYIPSFRLGGFNFNNKLETFKWGDDKNLIVTGSETIFVPETQKDNKWDLYLNSEFRQGVEFRNKSLNPLDNTSSVHIGVGTDLKFNRHKIGLNLNRKLYGNEILPENEIKFKYQFYLTK